MIALVTACAGGIDAPLRLPAHSPNVRSIYFRDEPLPREVADTWTLSVQIARAPFTDARLTAKRYKCQIHRLPETEGAEFFAWADSCIEFHDLDFLEEWARKSGGDRAVFVPHPDRQTVVEEYDYVMRELRNGSPYLRTRYSLDEFEAERALFGHLHDLSALRLWCGGIWLLPNTHASRLFLDSWWWTVRTVNIFDQSAISPLLAEAELEVVAADMDPGENLYRNSHWRRIPHP